jgi:hypothetical protein
LSALTSIWEIISLPKKMIPDICCCENAKYSVCTAPNSAEPPAAFAVVGKAADFCAEITTAFGMR